MELAMIKQNDENTTYVRNICYKDCNKNMQKSSAANTKSLFECQSFKLSPEKLVLYNPGCYELLFRFCCHGHSLHLPS